MKDKSLARCAGLLAACALLTAGCGGIRGNYQASPASMMLLKASPAAAPSPTTAPLATGGLPPSVATVD